MSPPTRLRQRHSRTSSGTTRGRISARTHRRLVCVRSGTSGGRLAVSVDQNAQVHIVRAPRGWRRMRGMAMRVGAFAVVELQKLRHDHTELFTRMVQPALWLLIFGQTFNRLRVINTGDVPYLAFLAPGIIAQSAMFISIFYGIQLIWDRDAGILAKLMVTPAPASALITGKAFAAGVRSVVQVIGVLALAYLLGAHLTVNPLKILGAMAVVVLAAAFFACLSMTLAGLVRNRDRMMGIGQAITMPLFFASNALYPVNALRGLLIGSPSNGLLDIAVLVVAAVAGIAMALALLRRLVR